MHMKLGVDDPAFGNGDDPAFQIRTGVDDPAFGNGDDPAFQIRTIGVLFMVA